MEKGGGQKGKIGQEKKEEEAHLLVLGFPSLEQEEWGWKGLGQEEVPSRRRGHAGPEPPLESSWETEGHRLWFSRRQG